MDHQSDQQQWGDHDVPESPQKAAEDMKAQEESDEGLLPLQWDVFLPKHIKCPAQEVMAGKEKTLLLAT